MARVSYVPLHLHIAFWTVDSRFPRVLLLDAGVTSAGQKAMACVSGIGVWLRRVCTARSFPRRRAKADWLSTGSPAPPCLVSVRSWSTSSGWNLR